MGLNGFGRSSVPTSGKTFINGWTALTPPLAPTDLTATVISGTQIDLEWVDNSSNEMGFKIYRSTDGGSFSNTATVAEGVITYSDTTVTAGHSYAYKVLAFDADGYTSGYSNTATAATSLPAPTSLGVTVISSTQLNLSWTSNSPSASGFKVERKTGSGGTYAEIASVTPVSTTTYNDTSCAEGTEYYYQVRAFTSGSVYSNYCTASSATTTLIAPTNLAIGTVTNTSIALTWTDNSSNEDGYKIERKIGVGGTYTVINTTAAGAQTYTDNSVSETNTYYYRVRAYKGTIYSAYATEVNTTIPFAAPTNLAFGTITSNSVQITWTDNSNIEDGYKVERKTGSGGTYTVINTTVAGAQTYTDNSALDNTVYYYRVRAFKTAGTLYSTYATEINTTTPLVTPSNLQLTVVSSTQINLTWTGSTSASGFKVEMSTPSNDSYSEVASLGNVQSYNKTSLTGSTAYYFRVRSYSSTGPIYSSYCTEQTATTAAPPQQRLFAWGDNSYGQIGDGTIVTKSVSSPVQIGSSDVWNVTSGGFNHSHGIKSNGTLWSWGDNSSGQLGIGNYTSKSSPVQVGSLTTWANIFTNSSINGNSTLILQTNGELFGCGYNGNSQLGNGNANNQPNPSTLGYGAVWTTASLGATHGLGIRTGNLYTWGANNYGQLGNGTNTVGANDKVPVKIGTLNTWASVIGGNGYSLSIKTNGTLWAWGRNQYGQLGNGDTYEYYYSPIQIGSNTWNSIAAMDTSSFGVTTDGKLWSWGDGYGKLGRGTNTSVSVPTQIGTQTDWSKVWASQSIVYAIKTTGALYRWGDTGNNSPVMVGSATDFVKISGGSHALAIRNM